MLLKRCLKYKKVESKRMKIIYSAHTNQKNAGVAIKQGRFQERSVTREKVEYFSIIKCQASIKIKLNFLAFNHIASKYTK